MYHLKLCRSLSYRNASGTVKATRQKPDVYIEDKAVADVAVASGYFQLVEGGEEPGGSKLPLTGRLDREQLKGMTIPDLRKLAEDMGVFIKGLKDKGLIIGAILAHEASAPDFDPEALAGMELEELTAYAAANGISLKGVPSTKEDVLEAICVANGGSYTMLDLMRE